MTPELEQLADEAIEVQCADIERALTRHVASAALDVFFKADTRDHIDRSRGIIAATWASHRPALTQLANARRSAIARLAEQDIIPEPGCTVTVGRVTLEAVRDLHPVSHRYEVMRGRERAGWAWLSTGDDGQHGYVVQIGEIRTYAGRIERALQRAAMVLADTERRDRTEAGAR